MNKEGFMAVDWAGPSDVVASVATRAKTPRCLFNAALAHGRL